MSIIDSPQMHYQHYLKGGGEMGRLTREFDWSGTVIGSPDTWSQSLLTTVSIILNSRFPMFLWWGPDLIQFYNDAYRPSFGNDGKHPKALGQRGEDCWPEIWPVIKPLIDQVLTTGEPTWSEDQLIPIYRNNRLEDVYWTFGYSAVIDETGNPGGVLVICNETTNNVLARQQLEESEKRVRFMLNSIPQHVWTAGPDGMLDYVNQVVSDDFGKSPSEIVGEGWHAFIHPDDLHTCLLEWGQALQTGNEYVVEFRLRFKDGSYKWHLARALPLLEDGKIKLWVGTNTNIELQKNNEQKKDEFLSVASHELKTPLTSLKASMQILQRLMKDDRGSDKLPLFIDKASNNLNKLLSLMDDLMNVSKIQHGQLALNKTRIDMVDLINDACEHVRMAGGHKIVLMGDTELMLYADYRRLDQVVTNLVNNAVKYAPQSNRIEITVEHDAVNAKVSVRDFGIGVRPEKIPHLFDRYYRVDSLGVQFSGLGLGLYISAEIIKRHGGQIGVDSELGEGSTFWFTLPMSG